VSFAERVPAGQAGFKSIWTLQAPTSEPAFPGFPGGSGFGTDASGPLEGEAGMLLNPLRASSKSFTRRTGERLRLRIYARTDFHTRDLAHVLTAINPWLRIQRWQRHRWWCGSSCRLPAPVA
jgi:hypothetical protein